MAKLNNNTKLRIKNEDFNYHFFLNCVKTGMNETRASVEGTALGNPYISEVVLWSIVDDKLFRTKEHSYEHFIIASNTHNSFKYNYSQEMFDEAAHFIKNPRFECELTREYFYQYGDVLYPEGYSDNDLDYINRFFDYINSKSPDMKNDYTINGLKKLDHKVLSVQWRLLAKTLSRKLNDEKIQNEASMLTRLSNSDLQEILKSWDAAAAIVLGEEKDAEEYCNDTAKLFLQSVAVSVMLTKEETPITLKKIKQYLMPYGKYESRLSKRERGNGANSFDYIADRMHNDMLCSFGEAVFALNEWKLDPTVGSSRIDVGAVYTLLREFRHIYSLLVERPSYFKSVDKYFRDIFFASVNNPIVQKKVIFRAPKEFGYLFELYTAWIDFIKFTETFEKHEDEEYFSDNMRRFDLIDRRIINDIISSPKSSCDFEMLGKDFVSYKYRIRLANTNDFEKLHMMHNPKQGWNPKMFISSSDKGLKYAIDHNQCWLIEDVKSDKIACCSIIVPIEYTAEDLKIYSGMRKCQEEFESLNINECKTLHFSEFNSVIVSPEYRGLGFQRLMLSMCYWLAATDGAEYIKNGDPVYIGAEVSPINPYSHNNFDNMGYKVWSKIVFEDHDSVTRDFVAIRIEPI